MDIRKSYQVIKDLFNYIPLPNQTLINIHFEVCKNYDNLQKLKRHCNSYKNEKIKYFLGESFFYHRSPLGLGYWLKISTEINNYINAHPESVQFPKKNKIKNHD